MFRTLITLVLSMAQLLAGNGASVYLCIGSDGSYCLDAGPDSCACIQGENAIADSDCKHEHGDSDCDGHTDSQPVPNERDFLSSVDAGGCTHIPILVSSEQQTSAGRASLTVDAKRLAALFPWPLSSGFGGRLASPPEFYPFRPPSVANSTLTAISTVVIRC